MVHRMNSAAQSRAGCRRRATPVQIVIRDRHVTVCLSIVTLVQDSGNMRKDARRLTGEGLETDKSFY